MVVTGVGVNIMILIEGGILIGRGIQIDGGPPSITYTYLVLENSSEMIGCEDESGSASLIEE